jgi:hypothetical protein
MVNPQLQRLLITFTESPAAAFDGPVTVQQKRLQCDIYNKY